MRLMPMPMSMLMSVQWPVPWPVLWPVPWPVLGLLVGLLVGLELERLELGRLELVGLLRRTVIPTGDAKDAGEGGGEHWG